MNHTISRLGIPARVKSRGGWYYINFTADWRSDFTIVVAARARRLFRVAGLDLAGLEGRRIRVRGWVKSYNGPMIEATHPEQIEVID